MKILYFDLETTGVKHWKNSIHQLSGYLEIDGNIIETFDFKMQPNPKAEIDKEALIVSKINEDILKTYQPFDSGYKGFVNMISSHCDRFNKKDKIFLCGYNNASFDNQFLRAFFVQNNDNYFGSYFWSSSIDVMVLASQYLMKFRHEMPDFKLMTVAKYLGIEIDEKKAHDALYDVMITREIYKHITK